MLEEFGRMPLELLRNVNLRESLNALLQLVGSGVNAAAVAVRAC